MSGNTSGPKFGLDAALAEKEAAKWDPAAEAQAKDWIQKVTGEQMGDFIQSLKNGQLLCKLANAIKPGSIARINTLSNPFQQRENISNYLRTIKGWGVPDHDIFNPDDLFEERSVNAVLQNIFGLARIAPKMGYTTHTLGPRLATGAPAPQFSAEQAARNAAQNVPILNQGSNSGAGQTQSGVHDHSRDIIKTSTNVSNVVPLLAKGSSAGATQAGSIDTSRNIVRNTGTGTNAVPILSQGSTGANQAGASSISNEINKGTGGGVAAAVSRLNMGSNPGVTTQTHLGRQIIN